MIKRMFCKLKNWRRVATRYDRLARNYLSGLHLNRSGFAGGYPKLEKVE